MRYVIAIIAALAPGMAIGNTSRVCAFPPDAWSQGV
jgi:hypothetical protein